MLSEGTKRSSDSGFSLVTDRMALVETGLNRIRLEFDLWREGDSNSSARDTTDYVYDVMKKLSQDVREMKRRVEVVSMDDFTLI